MPKLAEILGVSVEQLIEGKKSQPKNNKTKDLINLILKAVALAMGIAVTVLEVLEKIDTKSALTMLGTGLAAIAVYLLDEKR